MAGARGQTALAEQLPAADVWWPAERAAGTYAGTAVRHESPTALLEQRPRAAATADLEATPPDPVVLADRRPRRAPAAADPTGVAAWAVALRVRALPATLLGGVVGALVAAGQDGLAVAPVAVALLLLTTGHGLACVGRDLGDARRHRAGVLARRDAGRAALALAGTAVVLLAVLTALRPIAGAAALAGVLVVVLAVSRKAGRGPTAFAGGLAGAGSCVVTVLAAAGRLSTGTLGAAAAAGGLVAGALLARRHPVPEGLGRVVVGLPYAAVGLGVATAALPLATTAVALALPVASRSTAASGRGGAVTAHARLAGLLLVAGLAVAACS